jgi:hypothetical protein
LSRSGATYIVLVSFGDGNGYRYREVVQSDKGIWVHSAFWRRSRDVFVHISAVERAGLSSLNEGKTVEYEIETNLGKESAVNLKIK